MKIRRTIVLFCLATTILIALLLWFRPNGGKSLSVEIQETTNAVSGADARVLATEKRKGPETNGAKTDLTKKEAPDDPRRGLAGLNDVPIIFDGRIEDQSGNAIAGAKIDASVRIYNGSQSTVERFTVTSDAIGYFHIDHGKGESLVVVPSKEGYILGAPNNYFKYSYMYPDRFVPDAQNPTVIKMWKLQGAEPLIWINQNYRLEVTSKPINIDLLLGKIVTAGGDLKITIARPPGIVSEHKMQDWGLTIEAIGGGLMETSFAESSVAYQAPQTGYDSSYKIAMKADHWTGVVEPMFFVKSRDGGVFSKIHFIFGINANPDDPASLTIQGVANAKGSPNWEATAPR